MIRVRNEKHRDRKVERERKLEIQLIVLRMSDINIYIYTWYNVRYFYLLCVTFHY